MDQSLYGTCVGTRVVNRIGLRLGIMLAVILTTCLFFLVAGGSGSPVRRVGDLDGNGKTEEYILADDGLTVREGEAYLWQSPPDWRVDSFALGDVDNDGTVNLVVSLWKRGSFGTLRPFWQTGEDESYKNHLFVFKLQDNMVKSVWCSSDLYRPIASFAIRDVNEDGLNELVVEEGQYRKVAGERYTLDPNALVRTTIWQWEEWGFRLSGDR